MCPYPRTQRATAGNSFSSRWAWDYDGTLPPRHAAKHASPVRTDCRTHAERWGRGGGNHAVHGGRGDSLESLSAVTGDERRRPPPGAQVNVAEGNGLRAPRGLEGPAITSRPGLAT